MSEASDETPFALSNEALLLVLEGAPDAILLSDSGGILRFVNRQAETLLGYTRAELLGKPLEILVPTALRSAHGVLRARYMQAPTARPMSAKSELLAQRKSGETFAVEVSLSPIATREGHFVASAVRDISERKRHEAEARLSSQRLLSAVDSIQTMFALFDGDDRLVLCNSEFRQLFSSDERPVLGRDFDSLFEGERSLFAVGAGDALLARWREYRRRPSGTLDVHTADGRTLRIAERETPEGGRVTTIWNVSEDAARARQMQQAREQAEAASAAKNDFLASMSHELRTPLNAILGFTQLLERDRLEPPSERQRERLNQVLRAGEHLLRLVEDVLDLSRIEARQLTISLELVALDALLDDVICALEASAARAGIKVERDASTGEALCVQADRTRLMQVLMNFGSNAIKYGKRGGFVQLRARVSGAGRIRVEIRDDGQGIAREHQDKLFEPFQRAGQELGTIEGTGIGLAISKRLAALMHGEVGFESERGLGSTFWVELPARSRESAQPSKPQRLRLSQTPVVVHPRKLLYIEDNPSNVVVMRELTEELDNVKMLDAASAERGLELVRHEEPDVVIMDINLPGISGWEAARRMKADPETRAIPLIALSAATLSPQEQATARKLFDHYLTKPVALDDVLETIESALRARSSDSRCSEDR